MTTLHPRLAADTRAVAESSFAWLRYMNDTRFAWLILVPKQADLREWYQLNAADQHKLLTQVNTLSRCLQETTDAAKMNLGALGNMVPQLHLHIIARSPDDACWPGPVWGQGEPLPYAHDKQPRWLEAVKQVFEEME